MRIFNSAKEAFDEIERDIFEMGTLSHPPTMQDKMVAFDDNYSTNELISYSYSISNWDDMEDVVMERIGEEGVHYCYEEIGDRFNQRGLNPGNSWLHRKNVWQPFLEENGKFAYTYSERMSDQISKLITELGGKSETRRRLS